MSVSTTSEPVEPAPVDTMAPSADPLVSARAVETARVDGILFSAEKLGAPVALARSLINEGVSLDVARQRLIDANHERGRATQVNTVISGMDYTDPAGIAEDVATALAHRLHPGVKLEGRAREMRGMRAAQLVGELMSARGVRMNRFDTDRSIVTRAGLMTSSDLPGVLASALNKALLPGFEPARSGLVQVARHDTVRDFRTASRHRIGEFPQLLKVNEHGEYQSGSVAESKETFQLEKFGRILGVSWEMIIADDLEALAASTSSAALAAATLEADALAYAVTSNPTLSDGTPVFHSNRGNVGQTPATIGNTSVGELAGKLRTMKSLDGKTILNVAPQYIVTPAAIEWTARQFVSSAITPDQASNLNAFTYLVPIIEPRLDATDPNCWYLFGSPSTAPSLCAVYLEGEETPMVETRQGFTIDGMEVKVRWSFRAFWVSPYAAYNAGA